MHLFGMEAAVKLLALHPRRHFAARGAGLDAAVTLATYPLLLPHLELPPTLRFVSWAFLPQDPAFVRVIRVINTLRLFKLVKCPQLPCPHKSTVWLYIYI